ncbi:MAG: phosphoribosylamine--glycine ligase [Acidobacteriota bacterium]
MKVLVVGSGAREHALCWRLSQSPKLKQLYCAPGNPGIEAVADRVPIAVDEVHKLADFAADLKIDLTVVGPELPLSLGLADELQSRGLAVFGPSRRAAELESSKIFAKEFMRRHGVPTPDFRIVHDIDEAREAVRAFGLPSVLKADGLAAGKGVLIPRDDQELETALATFFAERRFGAAADRVLVERFLPGEEVSFIALSDGERVLPFAPSKDYKRIGEGDTGPNTGGMGAHSPAGVLNASQVSTVLDRVVRPTIAGMREDGRPFVGVLYAGLMLTAEGPQVLEYNVRFGDPECQPLMLRLQDDLLEVLASGAAGRFDAQRLRFRKEAAACVVLASEGYPGKVLKGQPISGLDAAAGRPGVEIFHAGTRRDGDEVLTSGGRVLSVCASGADLLAALRNAYEAAGDIRWSGKILRRDIGRRVLHSGAR